MSEPITEEVLTDLIKSLGKIDGPFVFVTGKGGLRNIVRIWYSRDYTFRELLHLFRLNLIKPIGTGLYQVTTQFSE